MQPVFTPLRTAPSLLAVLLWALFMVPNVQAQRPIPSPVVEIRTELGVVKVELFNETPLHRDNFLKHVNSGAYDSLLFHRSVPGLIVQGGDPASKHVGPGLPLEKYGAEGTLAPEIVPGLIHKRGALAAAREGDERNPDMRSDSMQFFFVLGSTFRAQDLERIAQRNAADGRMVHYSDQDKATYARLGGAPHLDGGYTVFGEVVEGMAVIEALAALPCNQHDRPLKDIRMFMRTVK